MLVLHLMETAEQAGDPGVWLGCGGHSYGH